MTKLNVDVAIQFLRGKNEDKLPEICLFRDPNRKQGQATYKFYQPTTITLSNLNSIKTMYLIDEEGELTTSKLDVYISKNDIIEVKSIYNWNSESEFERFMRFAERYAHSHTNY